MDPQYEAKLNEIKGNLRDVWLDSICDELTSETGYTKDEILESLINRLQNGCNPTVAVLDSFIIEALEGNL